MRQIVIVFLFFLVSIATPFSSHADVAFPGWDQKTCQVGEVKYVCDYSSKTPFGIKTYANSECEQYSKSQDYYLLTGRGSSFGGEEWYCLKAGRTPISKSPSSWAKFVFSPNPLTIGSVVFVVGLALLLLGKIRKGGTK